MKERPLICCAESVRGILDGRKTQTRRVIKDPAQWACLTGDCGHWKEYECQEWLAANNPFGKSGDGLWVREEWRSIYDPATCREGALDIDYSADPKRRIGDRFSELNSKPEFKWKSAFFMPRWASRITLEIVSVRAENLHLITPEDCIAEGIDFEEHKCGCEVCAMTSKICPATSSSLIMEYRELWDRLNAKRGFAWADNPLVWVISFRPVNNVSVNS